MKAVKKKKKQLKNERETKMYAHNFDKLIPHEE